MDLSLCLTPAGVTPLAAMYMYHCKSGSAKLDTNGTCLVLGCSVHGFTSNSSSAGSGEGPDLISLLFLPGFE